MHFEASYNENLVDDGGDCLYQKRKFQKSIISRALSSIKALTHVVPQPVHMKLGKVFKVLPNFTLKDRQNHDIDTGADRADQE